MKTRSLSDLGDGSRQRQSANSPVRPSMVFLKVKNVPELSSIFEKIIDEYDIPVRVKLSGPVRYTYWTPAPQDGSNRANACSRATLAPTNGRPFALQKGSTSPAVPPASVARPNSSGIQRGPCVRTHEIVGCVRNSLSIDRTQIDWMFSG